MKVLWFDVEVDIPADPVAFIKEKVIALLNYLGYEWPVTDTGVLDSWAARWDSLNTQLNSYVTDLESGVRRVKATNEGDAINAMAAYMGGSESNLHSLTTVRDAAPLAANGYRAASMPVTGLRAYVIGQIILDAVSLAAAIISGGLSAGASFLAKQGVGALINIAIDQAINQLLGG